MNIESNNSSCKKATVLMSKSMEEKLSLQEKASLAAHLAICKTCCFCFKQLTSIKKTIAYYADAICCHPVPDKHKLSENAKQKIKNKINESK